MRKKTAKTSLHRSQTFPISSFNHPFPRGWQGHPSPVSFPFHPSEDGLPPQVVSLSALFNACPHLVGRLRATKEYFLISTPYDPSPTKENPIQTLPTILSPFCISSLQSCFSSNAQEGALSDPSRPSGQMRPFSKGFIYHFASRAQGLTICQTGKRPPSFPPAPPSGGR